MSRYEIAPYGYECPYKGHCPHLDTSTSWALNQIWGAEREHEYAIILERHIQDLEWKCNEDAKTIAELKARLKKEHSSKFKPNRKVKQKESAYNREELFSQSRPRGAPKGHPPWNRPEPDHVDKTVNVPPPQSCPHCNTASLKPTEETHSQLQEDIVLKPRTVVTEFIHSLAYCPTCRRDVFATADNELRNCSIGPVTKAVAVHLRHTVKLSYRDTKRVLEDLFGMSVVPASAMAFDRTISEQGRDLYEELCEAVKAAAIIHGDETHWRINGNNAHLWYAGNQDIAYYHVNRSRASKVAVSIFGDDFQGALCADAYAGYNAINSLYRQSCLAHITRKAKDLIAEFMLLPKRHRDEKSLNFLRSIRKMITRACRIGAQRNNGLLCQKKALLFIPRFKNLLDLICENPLKYKKAEKFRQRLLDPKREYNRLFTFLEIPGMEPTNNQAEQSLRLAVIFRKICFGNRSEEGAESISIILSLITTAKRQKKDPLLFLQTLLTQGSEKAKSFLYARLPSP